MGLIGFLEEWWASGYLTEGERSSEANENEWEVLPLKNEAQQHVVW